MRFVRCIPVASLLLLAAACNPDAVTAPAPSAAARASSRAPERTTGRDDAAFPARWTAEELNKLRKTVVDKTDRTKIPSDPPVGAQSPVLHDPVAGRKVMTMTEYDPVRTSVGVIPEGQVGEPIDVHSLMLRRAPWAVVDERGKVTIRWETLLPTRATSVYFGACLPDDPLAMPRYRKRTVSVKSDAKALQHEVSYAVRSVFNSKYDVAGVSEHGRGVLEYRLEMVDEPHATTQLHDDRVGFRCDPVPCGEGAKYTQLPTVTMGPTVDMVTTKSAHISWTTDVHTAGYVVLKSDATGERIISGEKVGTRHEVEIKGLHADEHLRYHVMSVDHRGEVGEGMQGTLRGAPAKGMSLTFAVLSDSRSGNDVGEASYGGMNREVLRDLLALAYQRDARLVLFAGDLIDGYTTVPSAYRKELRAWQRSAEAVARHVPIYEAIGNHEALIEAWSWGWGIDRRTGDNTESVFAELFVNPENAPAPGKEGDPVYKESVYSFDVADAHFVALNSNYRYRSHYDREDHPAGAIGYREGMVTDEQLDWLDRDLEAARTRGMRHLFVYTHEPPFPNGGHVEDGMYWEGKLPDMNERRKRYWTTLVKHEVLATFYGDEHNYSRTLVDASVDPAYKVPIWSIISGGAGAPYYAQNKKVPWVKNVKAFSPRQHFVLVEIDGDTVTARAIDRRGREIDVFSMSDRK